jgi:hypothetical protein
LTAVNFREFGFAEGVRGRGASARACKRRRRISSISSLVSWYDLSNQRLGGLE